MGKPSTQASEEVGGKQPQVPVELREDWGVLLDGAVGGFSEEQLGVWADP